MVVPSGIAQAVHGRSHLAIPGQIGPSRHHHCPAHFAAEPPRDITPPRPFYAVGFVAANLPRSAGIGWARPGPCLARDGQTPSLHGCTRGAGSLERKVSGILPGASLPFAGGDPHTAWPAHQPEAQAHWKLNPPSSPVTSSASPIKYRPGTLFTSKVLDDTLSVSTPPRVTSAVR